MPGAEAGAALRHFYEIHNRSHADGVRVDRPVAVEAAVAFEYNGIGYAVMMASPVNLEDFALGFSMSERLVDRPDDILSIETHSAPDGWIVRIQLPAEKTALVVDRARQRLSEGSCGLCGLESLEQVMRPLLPVAARITVASDAIFRAVDSLRNHQTLNAATGAMHAAAFCTTDGLIRLVREDVGRHNALDKLLGALGRADIKPSTGFFLLTARCSFELVQKTVIAGCPLLVTVSAATTLALDEAERYGLDLISLARADSLLATCPAVETA